MAQTKRITFELPTQTYEELEKLATATGLDKTTLAVEALRSYIEYETWKIEEIRKAIEEADADDFATEADVDAVFKKWTPNAN